MFEKFADLFRSDDTVARIGDGFDEMLDQARHVVHLAGRHYFDGPPTPDEKDRLIEEDVKINKLERQLRKQIVAHLALNGGGDTVYGLLLMSLVKDVERIGDYAKNLSEIYEEGGGRLPTGDDENVSTLRDLRDTAEDILAEAGRVVAESDPEAARRLIARGVSASRRADGMIRTVSSGEYDSATAVTLTLGARFYKRISAHLVNVLTGVVMPLHKLDYYDEDQISRFRDAATRDAGSGEGTEE